MKICCNCKIELPDSEFYYEKGKPKGRCKNCRKIINKLNYERWSKTENGKLRIKENGKKYEQKIKEKRNVIREEKRKQKELLLKEKQFKKEQREIKKREKESKRIEREKLREYRKSNEWVEFKKQKEKERQYKKWKKKWKDNELFAMKVRLRNLIRNSFRRGGYSKFELKTENIIGMNYEEFKKHLESKFTDGMNWENRGYWHIDHIIPLSAAKTKEELIELCHYTNLQPLWREDNLLKSDKIL